MLREGRKGIGIGVDEIAGQRLRGQEVPAIGIERIGRSAALRRHHRQEGGDGGRGLGRRRHTRATASAAIMRASPSSPTRRSAETT